MCTWHSPAYADGMPVAEYHRRHALPGGGVFRPFQEGNESWAELVVRTSRAIIDIADRHRDETALTRVMLSEMLPSTKESRQEAAVSIAFFNRAVTTPAYAAALREGYDRILGILTNQLPPGREDEAATLFWLTQGLLGPVLIGRYTADEALALLDVELDRIFTPPGMNASKGR